MSEFRRIEQDATGWWRPAQGPPAAKSRGIERLEKDVTVGDVLDIERLERDVRFRAAAKQRMLTDLFWLAKSVLGYDKITERWHREVANVFVRKDNSKPLREQSKQHYRMLILPRRTYKTTFNIADTVQWILNFPEIAVMAMTAGNSPDSPLADAYVAECVSHFYCPEGTDKKPLHICFPEHVITKLPRAKGTFITPARKNFRRDPTLKAVSIEQSLSGWHPDIIKAEDVQDNRNSQTDAGRRKVRKNFYLNLKMLGEGGYVDLTCTRYGPADLYGDMIQKADENTIILWKPAYIRKPHAMTLDDDELTEQDVVLQFPEQLSWQFLREEKALDEESFWTQYMNIAEGGFLPTFPMERLEAAKLSKDDDVFTGKVHIAWRFEYGDSKFSACAIGVEREGRMTIVDVIRRQFMPTALARQVVNSAREWETHRVMIEATPGAHNMIQHIMNEALTENWRIDITWTEFLQDETARVLAIKAAEPHLLAGRLLFDDHIRNIQEVFRQLYQFGMIPEVEIPTVIARLAAQLPPSIKSQAHAEDDEAFEAYISQDAYDRTYNRGRYYEEPVNPVPDLEWEPPDDNDYLPGLSGWS